MKEKTGAFDGVWTAIIAPFLSNGDIDWEAFTSLLRKQNEAKVRGVVVFGTTGESPTLEQKEKVALIEKSREVLDSNIRVMAGAGSNNTRQTVELSQRSEAAGADSLLIVTPPYNKPSMHGLMEHLGAINESVGIPICLYHVPGRTGQFLSVDALCQLSNLSNVACVKEASGDIAFFSRAVAHSSACFLSGDDITYLASLAVGGQGCISVLSNIFPKAVVAMTDSYKSGNIEIAMDLHHAMQPLMDALFVESNPSPTKFLSKHLGLCENYLRLPLTPILANSELHVKTAYESCVGSLKALGVAHD